MAEQYRQQAAPEPTQSIESPLEDSVDGYEGDGAVEEELERLWAEFSRARASLAEVMSDDELRSLGFNLEVLDQRP